ncbi:hypothetical protein Pint_10333 [Pistacia integerrima]|uniref:Uncharacterized protein n=1 Tax=Pistacia integerrima TaxID=434235 RepID=A0ACC0XLH4_9ROSI|nr:hypothetical protein Pint_10333 [Pistacia integerrima]
MVLLLNLNITQLLQIFPLEISPALSMGCTGSTRAKGDESAKKIRKPKPWKHSEPITRTQLMQLRDEFWDTAPHYGGRKGMVP